MSTASSRRGLLARLGAGVCALSLLAVPLYAGSSKKSDSARAHKSKKPARSDVNALPFPTGEGAAGSKQQAPAVGGDYQIRPGDVLKVTVWKEPDLCSDATVRPDGRISVQLLGDVDVWLRSTKDVSEEIAKGLSKFIEEPQVTVAITQANSAKFYMIGQVKKPGSYALTGQISVLQSIALAGGFLPFAKRNKITLFRGVDGSDGVIEINFDKLAAGDVRQNFVLRPGDTIVVP